MIKIRPVSDLRNKFPEIETLVNTGKPVYLTKNVYGTMVLMNLTRYEQITDDIEIKLDEAGCAPPLPVSGIPTKKFFRLKQKSKQNQHG